jgi:hypothetical protein
MAARLSAAISAKVDPLGYGINYVKAVHQIAWERKPDLG